MLTNIYRQIVSFFLVLVLTAVPLAAQGADPEMERARQILEEQKNNPQVSTPLLTWILGGGSALLLGSTVYFAAQSKALGEKLAQTKKSLHMSNAQLEDINYQLKPMYDKSEAYLKYFNTQLQHLADHYTYAVPRYVQSKHPSLWKTLPAGREKEVLHLAQSAIESVFAEMKVTDKTLLLANETPEAYFKRVLEPRIDSLVRYVLARNYQYYGQIASGSPLISQSIGVTGRNTFKVFSSLGKTAKAAAPIALLAACFYASQAEAAQGVLARRLMDNPSLFFDLTPDNMRLVEQEPSLRAAYITLAEALAQFAALDSTEQQDILQQADQAEQTRRRVETENLTRQLQQLLAR